AFASRISDARCSMVCATASSAASLTPDPRVASVWDPRLAAAQISATDAAVVAIHPKGSLDASDIDVEFVRPRRIRPASPGLRARRRPDAPGGTGASEGHSAFGPGAIGGTDRGAEA